MNPNESSSHQPPRYVEHPARRRAWRAGQRNLAWGVAFLFASLSVLGVSIFIGGARAMVPLMLCTLSFTALWVLARMKVFAQRNGVFFSLATIALLGAIAALIEQAWVHLASRVTAEPRVATNLQTPAPAALAPTAPEFPVLIEALQLPPPDPALPRARAARDVTTTIGAKTYRIRAGDEFLFVDEKGGELALSAGEFIARVPADSMQHLAPKPVKATVEKPIEDEKTALEKQAAAQALQRAQQEAARRYPALGRSGTAENKAFVEAVADLKQRNSPLLDDPDWPIQLADTLGRRLGWKQMGVIDDETPAVIESKLAPGTKVLSEPPPPPPDPDTPDIPPPPREPGR